MKGHLDLDSEHTLNQNSKAYHNDSGNDDFRKGQTTETNRFNHDVSVLYVLCGV